MWKGIYDTTSGASFGYASQGSGVATSKRVSGTEYDGGTSTVGNGHVTKSRSYPNGDASGAPAPYETRYGYDQFDRLVATAGPEAPYASWKSPVTSPICCAATCSVPDSAPSWLPHWATETETNPLDIMCRSVSAERTGGADSGYRTTVVSTTDAMGRPATRERTIATPADYPSGFPGEAPCCSSETETNTWYRGRMTDLGLAIPSSSCVQHTQTGYPDTIPKIPPAFGWDTLPQYDNNHPLWTSRPGAKITTFTPMPPNMRKVYRRNPLGELEEYYEPHLLDQPFSDGTTSNPAHPIQIERDSAGRPIATYEPRPIPFNGTAWRTGIERDSVGRPIALTKGAGPIGSWDPNDYTTTERLGMQYGPWGLKQLDQQSMANCSGGGPVWSQQFTSQLPLDSGGHWQSAVTGCSSSAQEGWRGPYESARTLPGGITLNAQYDDYSSTARPTDGVEKGIDALIRRPTGQSFDLGSVTGTPLGSFASAGLARPHYRSTAGSGIESYTWTPTGMWGRSGSGGGPFDTSGGASLNVNPDWRGRTRGMAWALAMNVSSGMPDAAYGIFGYQLEWKDRTVAQAWDFVRTPYPSGSTPAAPITPYKTAWTSHFGSYDGPGTHEFAQAGCKDDPLIWCRAFNPSGAITSSGGSSTTGGMWPKLMSTMSSNWTSTSGSDTIAAPGMGPMEMYSRDCRGNPGTMLDDRDGSWNFARPSDPAAIDEIFVEPAPKACEDDAADQVKSWFNNVYTNGAAQAVKHDLSGHLTDDGYRFRYRYDASGRLTDVHKRSVSGSTVTDGDPVAHYGYNAAGWRTRADYDSNGNGTFDSGDTREYYQYDEQWRLTGIYRSTVPTGEDPDMGCPGESNPCLYQVYGYSPSGRTGGGGFPVAMAYKDTPSSRWRDTNCDGELDERLDIVGDAGGSVRMVMRPGSGGGEGEGGGPLSEIGMTLERYDYTPFGRPIAQPLGDLNGDGVVNSADKLAMNNAELAYAANNADYDPRADIDHDGDVDGDDVDLLYYTPRVGYDPLDGYADGKDHLSYGDGFDGNVGLDMRIGYRGYVWDPKLGMYHVRNRVYDPVSQRFIQPDPIGDAGGDHNWYRYVQNHPWAEYDPSGLAPPWAWGLFPIPTLGYEYARWVFSDPEPPPPSPPTSQPLVRTGGIPQHNLSGAQARIQGTNQNWTIDELIEMENSVLRSRNSAINEGPAQTLKVVFQAQIIAISLAGGVEDLAIMGLARLAGKAVVSLGKVSGKWIAKLENGTKIELEAAEAAKLEAALAKEARAGARPNATTGVNPHVGPSGENNCVNVALATDARLKGRPATAMPHPNIDGKPVSVLEAEFGGRFERVAGGQNGLIERMRQEGTGATGIVFGRRGDGVGHVFNVVNQNGAIHFIDGQTGRGATFEGYTSFELLITTGR